MPSNIMTFTISWRELRMDYKYNVELQNLNSGAYRSYTVFLNVSSSAYTTIKIT